MRALRIDCFKGLTVFLFQSRKLLTNMIPHCLANCLKLYKDNFNSLTQRVRRTLAGAIIDYFHRNNKKLATKIARNLAEQITQHFPTEKKVC